MIGKSKPLLDYETSQSSRLWTCPLREHSRPPSSSSSPTPSGSNPSPPAGASAVAWRPRSSAAGGSQLSWLPAASTVWRIFVVWNMRIYNIEKRQHQLPNDSTLFNRFLPRFPNILPLSLTHLHSIISRHVWWSQLHQGFVLPNNQIIWTFIYFLYFIFTVKQ